jgi:geranylgeranyl diphosphate synthase, type II
VIAALDRAALLQRMDAWRAAVDAELVRIADAAEEGPESAAAAALRYALGTGGKRLRPVLCLAAAEAITGTGPASTPPARVLAAAAVELVHTYSLVHDDLPCMDDDDLRRGRPTTHRIHGTVPAMVAGFALIPLACRELALACGQAGLAPADAMRAVGELCRGAGGAGMVGGQYLDLQAERMEAAGDQLTQIHGMKTGALFRAALRIGGILGGADPRALQALDGYGARLGLAFQITDDVLDVTMDAGALGKTPGKDVDAGKVTFVAAHGVAGARAAAVEEAGAATACLRGAGIHSPLLEALAGFAVDRDR